MGNFVATRRRRTALLALLTLVIVGGPLLLPDADAPARAPDDDGATVAGPSAEKLRILDISDAEVNPGQAIVVTVEGLTSGEPVQARIARHTAEVLSHRGDHLVVRVPLEAPRGRATLRVYQGARQSKGLDVFVEPPARRRGLRNIIGGLALFVVGLHALSRGFRGLAGHQVRASLGRLTRGSPRALAVGAIIGGLTQLTATSAAFTVSLLRSRLVNAAAAAALLVGAHLGAVVTSALLPLTITGYGMGFVAVGVLWATVATDRRNAAIGQAILGAALLFVGLHLVEEGVKPLVTALEPIAWLRSDDAHSRIACAGIGVVLSLILQGPGPVFALVVGLAQSSGALGLSGALAVLAGAPLGAALLDLIVLSASGRDGRRLARTFLAVGALATLFLVATVDLWTAAAEALVPGAAGEIVYGQRVLLPQVAAHIAAGFVLSALAAALLAAALVPMVTRRLERRAPCRRAVASKAGPSTTEPVERTLRQSLAGVLVCDRAALAIILELCRTGDRSYAASGEHALREARHHLEHLFGTSIRAGDSPGIESLRRAIITALQLQLTLDELLHVADRSIEHDLVLAPPDLAAIASLHELLVTGLAALAGDLDGGRSVDVEEARAREILLNACEAEARRALIHSLDPDQPSALHRRLGLADLLHAYENVGNPLYRVCEALASDPTGELL